MTHSWGNAASGATLVIVRLTPALRSEAFFASFCRVANEGHANAKAVPRNPLRLAVLAHEYRDVAGLSGTGGTAPALAILRPALAGLSVSAPNRHDPTIGPLETAPVDVDGVRRGVGSKSTRVEPLTSS